MTTDGTDDAGARVADARPDPAALDPTSVHAQIIIDSNPTHIQPRPPFPSAHLATSPCPGPLHHHLPDKANLTDSFFTRRTDICHPAGWRPLAASMSSRGGGEG